jgi:hypothetical protein
MVRRRFGAVSRHEVTSSPFKTRLTPLLRNEATTLSP